jgi:hypothetical protein
VVVVAAVVVVMPAVNAVMRLAATPLLVNLHPATRPSAQRKVVAVMVAATAATTSPNAPPKVSLIPCGPAST